MQVTAGGVANSKSIRQAAQSIPFIGAPDWTRLPSKGMPRLPDADYDAEIEKLGRAWGEASERGDKAACEELRAKADRLCAQYVSIVSPDRKAMTEKALKELGGTGQQKATVNGQRQALSLLDILNDHDAVAEKTAGGALRITLGSGIIATFHGPVDPPTCFDIGDSENADMTGYSFGNWFYMPTKFNDKFIAAVRQGVAPSQDFSQHKVNVRI